MKRTTVEILVREVVGTGVLTVGNPFGRQVIGARKQVSIFLWCIANQETIRLIADRMLHMAVSAREWFGAFIRKVYWP